MSEEKNISEEKERLLKLIAENPQWQEIDEIIGIDYTEEYRKQTGKDLSTGEYITQ